MTIGARRMSRTEVLERARGIAAAVAPLAERTEALRRLPPENVQAIMASGLMPMMRPPRFGGFGGDWLDLLNACIEVGRVCGSTGWCLSFLLHHQWIFAYFPDAAQKLVFGTDPDPKFVVSFAPAGRVRAVPGGFELEGEWPWGSGGDHCDWGMVNAIVTPPGGAPEARMFLLQPGQFRMRDVWYSVGLKGSGTNNIVVEKVFVPSEHTLDIAAARDATAPGCSLEDGPMFQSSFTAQTWVGILAPLIGAATGGSDAFIAYMRSKLSTFGEKSAESVPVQIAVGESLADLEAAFALGARINEAIFAGAPLAFEHRVKARRNAARAAQLALGAIDRLFNLSGAQGLTERSALQRHWRDAHAIANHFALSVVGLQNAGRFALGLGMTPGDALY